MTPKHSQFQVFIQAKITMGKKLKTCQEQPYWVSVCNDFNVQRNDFTTM